MPPPVVTGISPKEGPPGTRVTIRGEFLGNKQSDIIGVSICGCDCLLSAEWKSPNKIVARSGPGKGRGDIIITTLTGGTGTSTVQFRAYHEAVGPLKESAVWVEEVQSIGWGSTKSIQLDDPLGLSLEANENKFPEDDLQEMFPGCNGDLSSENFSPCWFLLQNHSNSSFDDLRAGLAFLRRKVDSHQEGQLSFLKGNVSAVMEQLEVLEALQVAFQKDVESFGLDRTEKIVDAIKECRNEGKMLFDGVLKGREKADRTRNALGVLHRFKFLFTLPTAIQRKSDYDAIISDYTRAQNLFGKTEVKLFKDVLSEVRLKVAEIKEELKKKLYTMPSSLDNQKKIIRNLVQLEYEGDPGWEGITVRMNFIMEQLNACHSFYSEQIASLKSKSGKRDKNSQDKQAAINCRVECIEDLCDIISILIPDLWSLGQSYFSGELNTKFDQNKLDEFKAGVENCLKEMCRLVKEVAGKGLTGSWPDCLQVVRAVLVAIKHIPHDTILALVQFFRIECVKNILLTTAEQTKRLVDQEDWVLIHDSTHGTITHLPSLFEKVFNDSLSILKESALKMGPKEAELFSNPSMRSEINEHAYAIFNNYIQCLDTLSDINDDEQSMSVSQLAFPTFRTSLSHTLNWEDRVLACISNCRYSCEVTVPRMEKTWNEAELPSLELSKPISDLRSLKSRLTACYIENRTDPLVGTVEPSMYIGQFEWEADFTPVGVRPYANEIIANVLVVHAQVERRCGWLKEEVLTEVVETVAEELSRLMLCVSHMSRAGAIQATLDITAVEHALAKYTTTQARNFFGEALDAIPALDEESKRIVDKLLAEYKKKMYMQLLPFEGKSNP